VSVILLKITIKADLSSFTIQGPAVYMFCLHEGAGYSWGTNSYSMMTYDADNGSPFFDNGSVVYFDYTMNSAGAEVYYPVHLDAGTYYFYCTLSADGESRAFNLYEPSLSSGSLYYSG